MTLKRVTSCEDGTFGVLLDDTIPFALTLELPWRDNRKNVSCIPAGRYKCRRCQWTSKNYGDTFLIEDVPGRFGILFHPGNTDEDTEGCVLVGEQFEYLGEKVAVLSSRKGFGEFMERLKNYDEFLLNIVWS